MGSKNVTIRFRGLAAMAMAIAMGGLMACGGGNGGSAPVAPSITTSSLYVEEGVPLNQGTAQLAASGTGPLSWTRVGGDNLPGGLSLASDGSLTGTASSGEVKSVAIEVTGPGGKDTKTIVIGVNGKTHRVSQNINGDGGNGGSGDGFVNGVQRSLNPGINNNGRYVVFDSVASNLIPGFTPQAGRRHIYIRDRETGVVELISKDSTGAEGNGDSHVAVVSDDGRFVAFDSFATNLVPSDTNASRDVFLRDRQQGVTTRISQEASGVEGACPAGQGENCNSFDPQMSADGTIIVFGSMAKLTSDDLNVDNPGDPSSFSWADVYVLNRSTGVLTLVTKGADAGSGGPAISADGRYIAFESRATTLVTGDTADLVSDVYRYDTVAAQTVKITQANGGGASNGYSFQSSISQDGSIVVFASEATNLTAGADGNGPTADIYFAQVNAGVPTITRASVGPPPIFAAGNGSSQLPSISRDGQFVAFQSSATNLVSAGTSGQQIFVLKLGQPIQLVSTPSNTPLVGGNADSRFPVISGDGSSIAFYSNASNLVSGDGNGVSDAFVAVRP